MKKRPEILSPAGNFEKLRFAVHYGADAVYLAGKAFGMRSASDNFDDAQLRDAVGFARARGVRVYVAVNVMPRTREQERLTEHLSFLNQIRPDALIISDPGVLYLAKRYAPDLAIHISTQANTVNAAACLMWRELGAKRVVLSRELSLAEISLIREQTPRDLELEVFVHGSMCVSYSGRCLLSNLYAGRDANRGNCAQPCRWEYFEGEIHAALFEKMRPEERLAAVEDSRGTYLFSSKDLCMIEHIPALVTAGVDSFKIEGRVKSAYYAAVTANTYKNELSAYLARPKEYQFDPDSLRELESVSHRAYSTGYFFDSPAKNAQVTEEGGYIRDKAFLATVEQYDERTNSATLLQRNKVCSGDWVELVSPGRKSRAFCIEGMRDMQGAEIDCSPHPKMLFTIQPPFPVTQGDLIRGTNK